MSTSHTSLTSAADERKARLAKLASLKRKQPGSDTTVSQEAQHSPTISDDAPTGVEPAEVSQIPTHLSGRNYDPLLRGPRLGFEHSTTLLENAPTVESQSTAILTTTLASAADQEAELRAKEASGTGGVDLFKLQPKKPNWDLKRELQERMRRWNVEGKTREAIARLVRERIETKKREALQARERQQGQGRRIDGRAVDGGTEDEGEEVGIEGAELVEGVHQREREEEEEGRREKEMDEELEGVP